MISRDRQAIVIGASSGIGRELARLLGNRGYTLGLAARRVGLLEQLAKEIPGRAVVKRIDVADTATAMPSLEGLLAELPETELVVISAGLGHVNPKLQWELERETIDVNVLGFAAMANVAMQHFRRRGAGHLVGISSIAAIRGVGGAPAYNASKAFMSNYLEGLRHNAAAGRLPITVTDIQPGFVDTAMAQGDRLFWVASPEKAARQIFTAIRRKRNHAYVTRRWRLIAWLLKVLPAAALPKE